MKRVAVAGYSSQRAVLRWRGEAFARIRAFFAARDVLEVQPPCLGPPAMDPGIESVAVPGVAVGDGPLYLQTSPESAMKQLLAAGSGDIYALGPVWRGAERGRWHAIEFTMLEWYRVGVDHWRLIDEVAELVVAVAGPRSRERLSYREAFLRHARVDPLAASDEQIAAAVTAAGVALHGAWPGREAALDLLLSHCVGPALGHGRATFLYGFPAAQAALARIDERDPRTARRFELFLDGIEIANGYHELTDPDVQRQRFVAEQAARAAAGLPVYELDEALLAALQAGLPDCAGVALGVDRLLAVAAGADRLLPAAPSASGLGDPGV